MMSKFSLIANLRRLSKDKKGATALEYGLLAALIAVAIIVGVTAFGGALNGFFGNLAGKVNSLSNNINSTAPATR